MSTVLLLVTLCSVIDSYPWTGTQWMTYSSKLNVQRYDFASFIMNDKLIAIGGYQQRDTAESSDISNNTAFNMLPGFNPDFESMSGASSIVYSDDVVYIGCAYSNTLSKLDITAMNLTIIDNVPTEVYSCCLSLYNDKIYVTGGQNDSYKNTNILQIYDIQSNSWSLGATMNNKHMYHGCEVVEESHILYVFGGDYGDGFDSYSDIIEKYDIQNDIWYTLAATLPTPRHAFYSKRIPFSNYILLNGGYSNNGYSGQDIFDIQQETMLTQNHVNFPQIGGFERAVTIVSNQNANKATIYSVGGSGNVDGKTVYCMTFTFNNQTSTISTTAQSDSQTSAVSTTSQLDVETSVMSTISQPNGNNHGFNAVVIAIAILMCIYIY